jgi:hypothetical protein
MAKKVESGSILYGAASKGALMENTSLDFLHSLVYLAIKTMRIVLRQYIVLSS